MIGLIKKDLLMIKGNLKIIAIICIVFTIMSINGNGNFTFIPSFISVMLMMSTFSYDEYNKSDAFIATFPNGKKNAVKSKYIATFVIILLSLIITFILSLIIGVINKDVNIEEIISTTLGCGFGILILEAIFYPIIYKFGIEKSRILIFIGVFGIVGLASLIMKNMSFNLPQNIFDFLENTWFIIFPFIVSIVLMLSYLISKHIYLKKEY